MVHNTLVDNCAPTDEKELKRISTLEQRVAEFENTLLRTAAAALEKRVAELEVSLKESNEECDKLRKTIVEMGSARKRDTVPGAKEENVSEKVDFTSESGDEKDNEKDTFESSDEQEDNNSEVSDTLTSLPENVVFDDREAEVIYGRILKLVENMKSDCTKAINLKIPTMMPGRSRAPSVSGVFIPSRPSTPSNGHQISPSISNSPTRMVTPSRVPSLPSLNGSRPSTPSSGAYSLINSIGSLSSSPQSSPVIAHNLRRKSSSISRPRTPNWSPSCSAPGTQSPPLCNGISIQSNHHASIISSGVPKSTNIPMHIPSMRNCLFIKEVI
ncbi:5928_t:CDS:2 [Acaulospora colombiana]|uniref:5928_t:CDS:1 n=1 Tax=Acaulospora colombiana TaxID=27376 RepID=A0ACA9K5C2_9GLOM|nr:5928_t:CDS:2 [Acaulospora colombiana]